MVIHNRTHTPQTYSSKNGKIYAIFSGSNEPTILTDDAPFGDDNDDNEDEKLFDGNNNKLLVLIMVINKWYISII